MLRIYLSGAELETHIFPRVKFSKFDQISKLLVETYLG
jgi:hypothetical protein